MTTVLDGLAVGEIEVVADDFARRAKGIVVRSPTTLSLSKA